MAQLLTTRREVMSARLLVTILLFGLLGTGAIAERQDGQPQDHIDRIPEGCEHLVSEAGEKDSHGQPTPLLHAAEEMGQTRDIQWSSRMNLGNQGEFTAQLGPFNTSNFRVARRVSFTATEVLRSANKTALNGFSIAEAHLTLTTFNRGFFRIHHDNSSRPGNPLIKRRRQNDQLRAKFEGVFSNRTGTFCATFCAGEHSAGQSSFTPAGLAFMAQNPGFHGDSDSLVERDCRIHIELQFPERRNIDTPFVRGAMTSLRSPDDPAYFHPLTISAKSPAPYDYNPTVGDEARALGQTAVPDISSAVRQDLKVWSQDPPLCDGNFYNNPGTIVWNESCGSAGGGGSGGSPCMPFSINFNVSRILPSSVSIQSVHCTTDWRVRAVFQFRIVKEYNASTGASLLDKVRLFELFAEGYWNFYKPGQLVMVAHYLGSDGAPVDTKIAITLQIPMARNIHHRHGFIGHVRSTRVESDPLHFAPITFLGDIVLAVAARRPQFRLSYEYDASIEPRIEPVCSNSSTSLAANAYKKSHKNAKFPDGSAANDLYARFSVETSNSSRVYYFYLMNVAVRQTFQRSSGHFVLSNGETWFEEPADRSAWFSAAHPEAIPVSFIASIISGGRSETEGVNYKGFTASFEGLFQMTLEGYYNSLTGQLCLLGCRVRLADLAVPYERDLGEEGVAGREACDVVLSLQYPPTNPTLWRKKMVVVGQISSLQNASHPRYFPPLAINSTRTQHLYQRQVRWTLLRRNAEIILSLGSLSLATYCIAVQVKYSSRKSNFRNLRFVSMVMLTLLTLGHFVLLLLGFTAFMAKRVPFWGYNRWITAHEVIMRGTSLVAFLLELRLLHLVWRSRTQDPGGRSTPQTVSDDTPRPKVSDVSVLQAPRPKVSDVSVLQACLPFYVTALVVVEVWHWQTGPYQKQSHYAYGNLLYEMAWADVQAISGVVLDLFLLPQVVANAVWDTEANVAPLHPLFYVGLTLVRSAEHFFDAARALKFIPELEGQSYYYANPSWDLYSTAWDIVIPCLAFALAAVLFLQQRFGGRFFVPKTRSRRLSYEPVPQGEL